MTLVFHLGLRLINIDFLVHAKRRADNLEINPSHGDALPHSHARGTEVSASADHTGIPVIQFSVLVMLKQDLLVLYWADAWRNGFPEGLKPTWLLLLRAIAR